MICQKLDPRFLRKVGDLSFYLTSVRFKELVCFDKAEGSKAEGSKAEGSKAKGSKAEGSKAEGSKAEGSKAEGRRVN